MTKLFGTPFHACNLEHNEANQWVEKGAFTVPAHYGDAGGEALAARVSAILADISHREDVRVHGEGAVALLWAAFAQDVGALATGASLRVQWCADGGGLRGRGTLHRFGDTNFLLRSTDADVAWFAAAAPRFEAKLRLATAERGLLLIEGPFALPVLAAAGLEAAASLAVGHHAICPWQGLSVALFRRADGHAYQLSCASEDGNAAFDRLWKRAPLFGLRLAGSIALETLQLEQGIAAAGIDWQPARDGFAREPKPASFMGVVLDADEPAPFSPILHDGAEIGRTLRSAYSPALKRAIALAEVGDATPGTKVSVRHAEHGEKREIAARIVALPFL